MTFSKEPLAPCPNCGQPSLRVIEKRRTGASARRRKECDECGHRVTTHEITQEAFELAKANASLLNRIRRQVTEAALPLCETCTFNDGDACNFELPEYNTPDAADCSNYQQ